MWKQESSQISVLKNNTFKDVTIFGSFYFEVKTSIKVATERKPKGESVCVCMCVNRSCVVGIFMCFFITMLGPETLSGFVGFGYTYNPSLICDYKCTEKMSKQECYLMFVFFVKSHPSNVQRKCLNKNVT